MLRLPTRFTRNSKSFANNLSLWQFAKRMQFSDVIATTTSSFRSSLRGQSSHEATTASPGGENKFVRIVGKRATMKVFIKERCVRARCRILAYTYIHTPAEETVEGRCGLSKKRGRTTLVATNFEQVGQSGIEWSFGDLAE